ncbi:hypothetical protein CNEO4_540027 [Clostridium neonatale]|nr:hypothetical protein CNEO2_520028 [Clostridium neonatale]CAI3210663.1 hypothetical protein CNEO2_440027 [Clostridium neonatale]CAI3676764.1 hypothetical protein CNEO4_540027 [Clostridium neonatale]
MKNSSFHFGSHNIYDFKNMITEIIEIFIEILFKVIRKLEFGHRFNKRNIGRML